MRIYRMGDASNPTLIDGIPTTNLPMTSHNIGGTLIGMIVLVLGLFAPAVETYFPIDFQVCQEHSEPTFPK